jgi:threonine dehydratase
LVTREDVVAARETVGDRVYRTPVFTSATLERELGHRVCLKAELFQRTGSFKPRGVLNKLASLSDDEKRRGVIGISAGNHAAALAWGAAAAGIDCLVVMWPSASALKIAATRAYGAQVDLAAPGPVDAFDRLHELLAETGRTLVHGFDDPLVIAGHGTLGLELADQVPDADTVVVPAGGGGLVSGIAATLATRVVAAEPERSAALHEGLAAGAPVTIRPESIADGLSAPFAGAHCLDVCRARGVESVLVTEEEIAEAMRFLYARAKLACEPAAAVGLAAVRARKVALEPGSTAVVIVSGGNVAGETAAAILSGNEGRNPS